MTKSYNAMTYLSNDSTPAGLNVQNPTITFHSGQSQCLCTGLSAPNIIARFLSQIRNVKDKGIPLFSISKNNDGDLYRWGIFRRAVLMTSIAQNKFWHCSPRRQQSGRHEKPGERFRDRNEVLTYSTTYMYPIPTRGKYALGMRKTHRVRARKSPSNTSVGLEMVSIVVKNTM